MISNFYGDQIPILTAERFKKLSKTHEVETGVFWTGIVAALVLPVIAQIYYATSFTYGVPSELVKSKTS